MAQGERGDLETLLFVINGGSAVDSHSSLGRLMSSSFSHPKSLLWKFSLGWKSMKLFGVSLN